MVGSVGVEGAAATRLKTEIMPEGTGREDKFSRPPHRSSEIVVELPPRFHVVTMYPQVRRVTHTPTSPTGQVARYFPRLALDPIHLLELGIAAIDHPLRRRQARERGYHVERLSWA
eukprot:4371095-Prymnesium_polylepis.1